MPGSVGRHPGEKAFWGAGTAGNTVIDDPWAPSGRCGTVARQGSANVLGPDDTHSLPRCPPGRPDRRLLRNLGGRPVPVARGRRFPAEPSLDRAAERADRVGSLDSAAARGDSRAADAVVGLRAPFGPGAGRRGVRVLSQHRPAEPGGAVGDPRPRRARTRAARSQHVLRGRHRRALVRGVQRGRVAARLRRLVLGFGLDRVARP